MGTRHRRRSRRLPDQKRRAMGAAPLPSLLSLLSRAPRAQAASRWASQLAEWPRGSRPSPAEISVRPNASRTQPTRRRKVQRGAGSAPARGGAAAVRWAAPTTPPRPAATSGQRGAATGAPVGQRFRTAGVGEMQPLHHGLRVAARARRNACGAALLGDFVERQEALAGALMGSACRQPAQVLHCLAPPGMINTQHDRGR